MASVCEYILMNRETAGEAWGLCYTVERVVGEIERHPMQITPEQFQRLMDYLEKELDDDLPFLPSYKARKLDIARQLGAGKLDLYATNEKLDVTQKINTLSELYAFALEGYGTLDAVPTGQPFGENAIDLGDYGSHGEAEAGVILAFLLREGQLAWETQRST